MPEDDARIILHYLTNRIDFVECFNQQTGGLEDQSVVSKFAFGSAMVLENFSPTKRSYVRRHE